MLKFVRVVRALGSGGWCDQEEIQQERDKENAEKTEADKRKKEK